MKLLLVVLLCVSFALLTLSVSGQEAAQSTSDLRGVDALRVFLDCDRGCDFDFLRREVVYVNWVRDRTDAQVHVLVTRERAGGGFARTLNFIGLDSFENIDHKLVYNTSVTDTEDEERRHLARWLQLGLVRYVLGTPMAAGLQIAYRVPEGRETVAARPEDDPWNSWVFRAGINGNLREEERQDSQSFSGSLSAGRTTEDWRIRIGGNSSYQETNFEFEDGETLKNVTRNSQFGGSVIRSLGPHWGSGMGVTARRSTFLNLEMSYRGALSLEYNVYPYSVSSERSLTFSYYVGISQLNYEVRTIFDEISELRTNHGFTASYDVEQPWGEVDISLRTSQFINDLDQYSAQLFGSVDYRIFRGLSLNFFSSASLIRNQIYLPAGGATDEEVLLQRRALATDSRLRIGIGLNYTFGSIYNNIVNSRLTGRSDGLNLFF